MASSVTKWKSGSADYWRFYFSSKEKKLQGLPERKYVYFPCSDYKKSDVETIKEVWQIKYKKGEFDPWTQRVPSGKKTVPLLSVIIREYLLRSKRRLAPNTHSTYSSYLKTLLDAGDRPINEVDFSSWVNSDGTWHTRRSRKIIADQVVKYAQSEGVDIDPDTQALGTRQEKKAKNKTYINSEQFSELLRAVDTHLEQVLKSKHYGREAEAIEKARKMKDILHVFFYMGLRINELLHCRPAWVLDGRLLRIGDLKQWVVPDPFTPKSQKEHDPPIAIPKEVQPIFQRLCYHGKYDRMFGYKSETWLRRYINEYFVIAFGDMASRLSPHSLRDSCASYWLNERKVPIQEVQRLLRHEKIETTMGYYHRDTDTHYEAFQ